MMKRLDLLDGFQMTNGLYGLSLLIAYVLGVGTEATAQVLRMLGYFHIAGFVWLAVLVLYVLSSFTCLLWKNRRFQVFLNFFSIWLWCFTGAATVFSPSYIAASGIYELLLATVNVIVLYLRGILND